MSYSDRSLNGAAADGCMLEREVSNDAMFKVIDASAVH